ncbi:MAG: tetratricopeptide repeat protein [Armatimonadota bacterium]|nr:tetratricopeptide repeat protein [Armatimonadota bacterium]
MSDERRQALEESRRHIKAGRPAQAIAVLERWLAQAGDDATAWSLLSAALSRSGDWSGAEDAAGRVVRLRPSSSRAWSNWGITLRKLDRTNEAKRAQRKALSLDPDSETARRELRKLEEAPPAAEASERCPECGAHVFPTDTQCLNCGADLLAARAAEQRAAEARARAEAAAREAQRREEAQRVIARLRAGGFEDGEIYGELREGGWTEEEARELLGVPDETWIVSLPEGRHAFVTSVDEAKTLRAEALRRVSELRAEKKAISQEIGELRSAARAARHSARRSAYLPAHLEGHDLTEQEALHALEEAREERDLLSRSWEQAVEALDAWIAQSY